MKTLAIMSIPLTQGLFALVDGEDYEVLSKYKWWAVKDGNTFYAVRAQTVGSKRQTISMHRQILNAQHGDEIDHCYGCGLDNRRTNIRFCTMSQNCQNQRPTKGKSSNFKGVSWHKNTKKWQVRIIHNRKNICLGYFLSEIEAAKAYDKKAKQLFGEFARTNF